MKNLTTIAILTIFLVGLSATNLMAQRRAERTRSANATYGYPLGDYKPKKSKKKKQKKEKRKKQRKSAQKSDPLYRKKNPWAN